MSRSTDPGHFFQTDTSDANAARKAAKSGNTKGDPIRLSSKILAVLADPSGARAVYVAESAGVVRRVDLATKEFKKEVYRGPEAPLTSLCIHNNHIYAGCWDKSIWTWPLLPQTGSTGGRSAIATTKPRQYHGHSDFVKTVACISLSAISILISGAQDGKIIIWNAQTSAKLQVLTGHARGVLSLLVSPSTAQANTYDIFSGGSEGQIRRWRITSSTSGGEEIDAGPLSAHLTHAESEAVTALKEQDAKFDVDVIGVHETSVNALLLADTDADAEDDQSEQLYTASSDNMAMLLPARPATVSQTPATIAQAYRKPEKTLQHPDFVRAIVPLAASDVDLVATACRDEGVRIWDTSEAGGVLLHCFDGHYEEVTGLATVGSTLVSVSIDGTVRTWPGTRAGIEQAIEKEAEEEEVEADQAGKVQLDADEEAELAALMEDD